MKVNFAVCDHRTIDPHVFNSRSRKPQIVEARFLAYYILNKHLDVSTVTIGDMYGYHHSAILYGIARAENLKLQPEAKQIAEHYLLT